MGAFSFPRGQRLLRPKDFRRLFREGKRFDSDYFVVLYAQNGLSRSRLGVTVSKRVGRAVTRNRVKRLVREHFRHHKAVMNNSYDVNVIAKVGSSALSSRQVRGALDAMVHDMLGNCRDEAIPAGAH